MSLEVIYSPLARLGMNEIADYLAQQNPQLGLRFLHAIADTCADLAAMPEMAGRVEAEDPRLDDLRVWSLREFPNHLIFYRIKDSHLEIVFIVFGGRDIEELLSAL